MLPRSATLLLLTCIACEQPAPAAAPAPEVVAPPAASPAAPPAPGLGGLLSRVAGECKVVGTPGSRPLGCDALLAQIAEQSLASGPAALPRWADAFEAMRAEEVGALSWLGAEHLPPIVRALRTTPDPAYQADATRITSAFAANTARGLDLRLLSEPVTHLAGLYNIPITALLPAELVADHTTANVIAASMVTHRTRDLGLPIMRAIASRPDMLGDALLDAPWRMGAQSMEEHRALCGLYAELWAARGEGAPRMGLLRGMLSCEAGAQRAALGAMEALQAPPMLLLTERCSPHPFSPWPAPPAKGLCDAALTRLAALATQEDADAARRAAAASAISKGWPTTDGEAALKRIAATDQAEVKAAAQRGLDLIDALRSVQRSATKPEEKKP